MAQPDTAQLLNTIAKTNEDFCKVLQNQQMETNDLRIATAEILGEVKTQKTINETLMSELAAEKEARIRLEVANHRLPMGGEKKALTVAEQFTESDGFATI